LDSVVQNFKIPKELHEKIKAEASEKGISMAAMIRIILYAYFEAKK
jgi:predicted HicB family RNase H-like nuclease